MSPDVADSFPAPSYSPYAGRGYREHVYWGDTHVHTAMSLDARAFGVTLDPEIAYRFARGEEVVSTHGVPVQLSRPLDWIVITDHSDGMGAMSQIIDGNPNLMTDATLKDWHDRINKGGQPAFMVTMDVITAFSQGQIPPMLLEDKFAQSVWNEVVEIAEICNEPGDR